MENLIKTVVVAFAILISVSGQAQTKTTALNNSLLWEVSGKGLKKPSYLYGTIHMICSEDYFLSEKANKAFEAADKLVLEANLSDPNELTFAQKASMGEQPLSKMLSAQQLADLDVVLQRRTGMRVAQLENFSLLTVMSLITMKSFGCQNLKSYEMEFVSLAKEKKMETVGLETLKEQMEFLDKAYSKEEMLSSLRDLSGDKTTKMVQNYLSENLTGLYNDIVNTEAMNANTKKWLLEVRNNNWAVLMPEMMKQESLFVAVGAAHLLGEQGVINLLIKSGYTVKPVMN